jgi:hypothetical protein
MTTQPQLERLLGCTYTQHPVFLTERLLKNYPLWGYGKFVCSHADHSELIVYYRMAVVALATIRHCAQHCEAFGR